MQVPAYVEYERATSVDHALALLARFGPEARVLAGGHSLIPMMKLRLAQPETLVDINGLAELSYIAITDPWTVPVALPLILSVPHTIDPPTVPKSPDMLRA